MVSEYTDLVRKAGFHESRALYSAIRKILVTRFYATVLFAVIKVNESFIYRENKVFVDKRSENMRTVARYR